MQITIPSTKEKKHLQLLQNKLENVSPYYILHTKKPQFHKDTLSKHKKQSHRVFLKYRGIATKLLRNLTVCREFNRIYIFLEPLSAAKWRTSKITSRSTDKTKLTLIVLHPAAIKFPCWSLRMNPNPTMSLALRKDTSVSIENSNLKGRHMKSCWIWCSSSTLGQCMTFTSSLVRTSILHHTDIT